MIKKTKSFRRATSLISNENKIWWFKLILGVNAAAGGINLTFGLPTLVNTGILIATCFALTRTEPGFWRNSIMVIYAIEAVLGLINIILLLNFTWVKLIWFICYVGWQAYVVYWFSTLVLGKKVTDTLLNREV